MEDSQVITLLQLCHEFSQIHEIPANHSYRCPISRMTHEIYKFHLGCLSSLDNESLISLCQDFKTCYTCFVLSCKQSFSISHPIIQSAGEVYLKKLLKDSIQFVQEIANEAPESKKLIAVGKFCETVEKFSEVLVNIQSYFRNELEKYKDLMESALEDLRTECEDPENYEFCERFAGICSEVLDKIESVDERSAEMIIFKCREGSECLDSLVCCVSII